MQSTQIRLRRYPTGEPQETDFEFVTQPLPELQDGQVLLRTIYLSLDPYMRGRMASTKSYVEPMRIGDVVIGGTVCEVIDTRSPRRRIGDLVLAFTGWQTHAVADDIHTRRLDPSTAPISTALGVLGMPGFTAYAGLLEIGRPGHGETLVVAAASGPVGSAVGQIARIKGARAVGIAGGPTKCRAVVEEFGFDAAVDHRADDFEDRLAAATSDGVDVYFENVGGRVTDAVLPRLNRHARVPVCGLVSGYNSAHRDQGVSAQMMMRHILVKSLTVRGFIQDEFHPAYAEAFDRDMTQWVDAGLVRYREDIVEGLEQAPRSFQGLLRGANFGKLLIRVAADPTR